MLKIIWSNVFCVGESSRVKNKKNKQQCKSILMLNKLSRQKVTLLCLNFQICQVSRFCHETYGFDSNVTITQKILTISLHLGQFFLSTVCSTFLCFGKQKLWKLIFNHIIDTNRGSFEWRPDLLNLAFPVLTVDFAAWSLGWFSFICTKNMNSRSRFDFCNQRNLSKKASSSKSKHKKQGVKIFYIGFISF